MTDLRIEPLQYIFGRRSIRLFQAEPVNESTIDLLLQAGMAAPSACGKEPWRFIVVRDKKGMQNLQQCMPGAGQLATAPVVIIVCGVIRETYDQQEVFLFQDCATATENIMIAAHMLGLGSCWIAVFPMEERICRIRTEFSIPAGVIPVCCIALGVPAEFKESRTRYHKEYIYYETWQAK